MLTETDKNEIADWQKKSASTEPWNDVTKLNLFNRAKNIIPILLKEIEVLNARLEIRAGK